MVDIDSLKLYWLDGASWTQITTIKDFPLISKKMDSYSICSVTLNDFEGGTFSDWNERDNTYLKIEDDFEHVLFQGYLKKKDFDGKSLVLTIYGFASKLDETPFYKSFILASGLVKTAPYTTLDINPPYSISETTNPTGVCLVGGYYYVCSWGDSKIYKYNSAWVYQSNTAIGIQPTGICHDGTFFYVLTGTTVYKFNAAWAYQDDWEITPNNAQGFVWTGTYFYIYVASADAIYRYDNTFTYVDTSGALGISPGATGASLAWGDGMLHVITTGGDVYSFDENYYLMASKEEGTGVYIAGFVYDGSMYYYAIEVSDETVIAYHKNFSLYADNSAIELKQDDEDGGYPDFTWDSNDWVNDRDVGLLIQDNTQGVSTATYTVSSISTDKDEISGDENSCDVANDGDSYFSRQTSDITDMTVTIGMNGIDISTAYTIQAIRVNYKIAGHQYTQYSNKFWLYLQISNGASWTTVASKQFIMESYGILDTWIEGQFILTGTLTDYLNDSDASDGYDEIVGMRIFLDPVSYTGTPNYMGVKVDYLTIEIDYTVDAISPIMSKIGNNGASWLMCADQDFSSNGVQAGDTFQIGENTTKIINEISVKSGVTIYLLSTLSKYMARFFKGTNCLAALNDVRQFEGLHWVEDHQNGIVKIAKESDFEDSGLDLDSTDFDPDTWNYEDEVNHFKGVKVYGNASLNIQSTFTSDCYDPDSTSFKIKEMFEDTIMTVADAQAVADAEFAEIKNKRPSIKLKLTDTDGSLNVLEPMKTVDITFVRPTIAGASYPLRRVDIQRMGEYLEYVIYAGLGSTPPEEKNENALRKIIYDNQKQNVFRLANTPLGAGASLTPDDIAGLDTYIQSFLLENSGVLAYSDYIHLQDQKAQNTDGGTFTSGAWRTRDLTTEVNDLGEHCSLASNQFTLEAGTYYIRARLPAYDCNKHQGILYNVTDSAVEIVGSSDYNDNGHNVFSHSYIDGVFTIAASKAFEIRHQCAITAATYGFGVACNFTTEIYTSVELWKIG